jgi:hypothetical protein
MHKLPMPQSRRDDINKPRAQARGQLCDAGVSPRATSAHHLDGTSRCHRCSVGNPPPTRLCLNHQDETQNRLDRQNQRPRHPIAHRRLSSPHLALRPGRSTPCIRRIVSPQTPRKNGQPPRTHARLVRFTRETADLRRIRTLPPEPSGPESATPPPRHRSCRRFQRSSPQCRQRRPFPR